MAEGWLQQNVIGPWGNNAGNGNAHERGLYFQVLVQGWATKMRWYRTDTNAARAINSMQLWHVPSGTKLAEANPAPDNGLAGWQEYVFPQSVQLFPNVNYSVAMHMPGSATTPNMSFTFPGSPGPGLVFVADQGHAYRQTNTPAVPTAFFSGQLIAVDVYFVEGDLPEPGQGVTLSDMEALFDSYFRADNDNGHQTAIPWLTWGQASGANSNAQNAWLSAQAAQTAAEGNTSAIANVSTAVEGIGGNVATLLNRLSADLAQKLNEMSDGLAGLLNDAASVLGGGWEAFVSQFTRASGGSGFGLPDSLAGWTLVDETDFTEEIAWPVAADRYVVTFTETPPRTPGTPVAGVDWHPRLAWWCELNTGLATERHYLDFAGAILQSPTGRMFGLLLNGGKNTAGHIQAWTKDA